MKINENSKFTLTIGQLRRLIQEAAEPLTKMSLLAHPNVGIIRLGPCNHQKALCWKLHGFCFTPVKVNPSFSKNLPYMVLCYQPDNGCWQMHFENFDNFDSKPYLGALYEAFTQTCEEEGIKEICAIGGCTPGGLSGISSLQFNGFKKVYQPQLKTKKEYEDSGSSNIYWSESMVDKAKLEKWLNSGKHLDEFLVIDNPEAKPEEQIISKPDESGCIQDKYTLQNTMPRPFHMVR